MNNHRSFRCAHLGAVAACAASILASAAHAQVTITAVDRSVFVSAFAHHPVLHPNYGAQESYENHTAGPWISSGNQGNSVGDELGFGAAIGVAGQQSDAVPARLWAVQLVQMDVSSAGIGSADVDVRSSFAVAFSVTASRQTTVSVDFEGVGGGRGFTLARAGGAAVINTVTDVNGSYLLGPGDYTLTAQVSAAASCALSCSHVANPRVDMQLLFAQPACPADIGVQGGAHGMDGVLDNNDFVVFVNFFFNLDSRADFGRQGGLPGADGFFDNNDFVVFISAFFNGCNA